MPSDYTDFAVPFAYVRMIEHEATDLGYNQESCITQYVVMVGSNMAVYWTTSRERAMEVAEDLKRNAEVWARTNGMNWKGKRR